MSGVALIVPGTYCGSLPVNESEQIERVPFELDGLWWKRPHKLFEAE